MKKFATYITKADSVHYIPTEEGNVFIITPYAGVKVSAGHVPGIFAKAPNMIEKIFSAPDKGHRFQKNGKTYIYRETGPADTDTMRLIIDRIMGSLEGEKAYITSVSVGWKKDMARAFRGEDSKGIVWINEKWLDMFELMDETTFGMYTKKEDPVGFLRPEGFIFIMPMRMSDKRLADLHSIQLQPA